MHECGRNRPRRQDHDRRGGYRERREEACHEHRAESGIDGQESPRVGVEVAKREPHGVAQPHPLTPAAVTPAMKYRWKITKMSRIGAIAIRLPAMSSGHSVPYWKLKVASPS